MMKSFALSALVLAVLTLAGTQAYAGPIGPDPSIGIRGGGDGSPDVTNGSIFALSSDACPFGFEGFVCAPYRYDPVDDDEWFYLPDLSSLDLSFWDANGMPIPTMVGYSPNFIVDPEGPFSDFQLLSIIDGNTVRLCAEEGAGPAACFQEEGDDNVIEPGSDLVVFSNTPGFVSVRAVNTVPNLNLPDATSPIPEPTTLALLGTGVVGLVTRARRRNRQ